MLDKIAELAERSKKLNEKSEEVADIISAANEDLHAMEVGVKAWLDNDLIELNEHTWRIGYYRPRKAEQWLICAQIVDKEGPYVEPIDVLKAPRYIRVQAVLLLEKLVDALTERVGELSDSMQEAINHHKAGTP